MKLKILFYLIVFLFSHSVLFSKTSINFELSLKDGSKIRGEIPNQELVFHSKFGDLKIPLRDITKVEVGFEISQDQRKKIIGFIEDLKSDNQSKIKKAEEYLLKSKVIGQTIIQQYRDENEIKDEKFGELLDNILAQFDSSEELREMDRIFVSDDSYLDGKLDIKVFSFKSKLGNLKVKKSFISTIVFESVQSKEISKTVQVMANKSIAVNPIFVDAFVNTQIKVKKGDKLSITASGTVNLASLSSNVFSPNGNSAQGNWLGIPYGALSAKIGPNGKPFLIGEKYNGIANESGILYLTISETVYNATNSGSYKVKIKLKTR